ncbi:MAG: nuclear transport factor 2 family protein [Gemmatimonadales bacterium]
MSRRLLALCVAAGVFSVVSPLRAQSADQQEVLAVVNRLFEGMRTMDTAMMRATFEPGARLAGLRPRQDGSSVLSLVTVDQFANAVANNTRGEWLERIYEPEVRIEGSLATVWAPYDFHLNGVFSHCGVDAFQLLKTGSGWKIVAVADTFQREGCPERM